MYLYRKVLVLSLVMMTILIANDNLTGVNTGIANNFKTSVEQRERDFEIIDTINVSGAISQTLRGIAWDGSYMWLQQFGGQIVKIDSNGNFLESIDTPGSSNFGLNYHENSFWIVDYSDQMLYQIDFDGNTLQSIDLNEVVGTGHKFEGIGYFDEHLWVSGKAGEEILLSQINLNGELVANFYTGQEAPNDLASCLIWIDNYLYVGTQLSPIFKFEYDGMNLTHIENLSAGIDGNLMGLTFDGQYLWMSNYSLSTIYKVDIGYEGSNLGCTDSYACNYNPDATEDDGSCAYEVDCAGECGGPAEIDECGVCGGDGSTCDDSNTMNVITGMVHNVSVDYRNVLSAGFYVFNDPITEDLNISLNGETLSKKRTYHHGGPMGGYTFDTDEVELGYADSTHLNVSGDFNFDYTVLIPTNMMITSHNDGDEIDPSDNMMITYNADNYDFFYFSYYIYYEEGSGHNYSGFTYDTTFTIQSELLEDATWISINVDALSGMHPIDEVLHYNENTMASIFGSNGAWLNLGVNGREESLQGTYNSVMDFWDSGEFSRSYSQFITESEDNSDNQLMDITSDDILIYSVMHYNEDYYNGDIIIPFIIISSPTYFEDTEIFVNGLEIETFYAFPFGIATTFGDNESEEYPTPQEINTYEIYINGEVISGEFSFSDSTEFTNWVSGQSYNGAEDLYIEWADNGADFYSVDFETWNWYGYEACDFDTVFITVDTNFTIPNTLFTNCLSVGSEIEVQVASVNGVVPIAGAVGDIENSYGFSSWAWNEEIYLYIPIDTECTLGDLNGDCELNILDVVTLVDIIMSNGNYIAAGDINGDGYLNIMDVVQLVNLVLEF